jgi:long-chain acyl-CoA synthetase
MPKLTEMDHLPDLVRVALGRHPALPVIEFEGRWHDWGELARIAGSVTAALSDAGIPRSAPLAFVPRNRPEAIAALLALLAEGRTVRMVYPFQSAESLAANLARLDVGGVVLHAQDCTGAVRECLQREGLGAVELGADGARAGEGLIARGAARVRAAPADPQIEILTSGTTGPPKHFPIPYSMLEAHFLATPLTRSQGQDPAAAPPFLLYFPLGNISGIYSTLPTLLRGQRAVLLERFSVAAWHDYVLRHRPEHSGVPPSCVQQVLDAEIPREDLASIRAMGIGAAPLDPNVQRAFEQRYVIPILLSYGATEFAGPVAMMTADLHAEWGAVKHGSVGRALPGVRLRVVDPDSGAEVSAGATGVLQVVSPRIGPDWIATSDLAVIDLDGFLYLKGRADGAIMRGGFKLLPETIEAALMLHPAVSEAGVTGIADPRLGEVPAAALRLIPGAAAPNPAELELHLRRHLLATHLPARWKFCDDLPRTPSHKVDRTALKALFESG